MLITGCQSGTVDSVIDVQQEDTAESVHDTADSGVEIASQSIVMPQQGSWDVCGDISFVSVDLEEGESYSIQISDGWNMSYLAHYRSFDGNGGGDEPYNFVNITEMKMLFIR